MTTPRPDATPVPERSLNRQLVLEEDEYTAALSHIIARDFFPSLVHLDATNDYLDAVSSRDPARIEASVRRMRQVQDTPYFVGDTPLRTPRGDEPGPSKRPRYDTSLNLDNFQARYTSEDNSSFVQILDEENRARKEKYGWAWEAQKRAEAATGRMIEGREKMLIEGPVKIGVREKFVIEAPKAAGLITEKGEEKDEREEGAEGGEESTTESNNQLALVTRDLEPVDVMAPKKDTRPAGVDGWKFRARNALMFLPDADVSPYTASSTQPDPKSISHGGTRMVEVSTNRTEPPSPTPSRIDAAIAGLPYHPSKSDGLDTLVPDIPTHTPADIGPEGLKQLMTWGSITATPRIISRSDEDPAGLPPPTTPFHIPAVTAREALSHRLSNNAAKSLRAKAELMSGRTPVSQTPRGGGKAGGMGPPSGTPRKVDAPGGLTPAAKRLLERTAGRGVSRSTLNSRSSGLAEMNKVRWTPTPGRS